MKITKFFGIAALIGLVAMSSTSCSKDETFKEDNQEKIVTLTVSQQVLSRTVFEDNGESLSVKWEKGDKLSVFTQPANPDLSQNFEFTLDKGEGTNTATFTGTVTGDPDVLYAYLVNKVNPTKHKVGVVYYPKHFCGSLNDLSDYHFFCAIFKRNTEGAYECVDVKNAGAVFKLNITGLVSGKKIKSISFPKFATCLIFRANNYALGSATGVDVISQSLGTLTLSNTNGVEVQNGSVTLYAMVPAKVETAGSSQTITLKTVDEETYTTSITYGTNPQIGNAYTLNLDFSGN